MIQRGTGKAAPRASRQAFTKPKATHKFDWTIGAAWSERHHHNQAAAMVMWAGVGRQRTGRASAAANRIKKTARKAVTGPPHA